MIWSSLGSLEWGSPPDIFDMAFGIELSKRPKILVTSLALLPADEGQGLSL